MRTRANLNNFGTSSINETNIEYSKAQFIGESDSFRSGEGAIRLVFRNDEQRIIDIANTRIVFRLTMDNAPNINSPLIPFESVSNLFAVDSIYFNGVEMDVEHSESGNMIYRRIRNECHGRESAITHGSHAEWHEDKRVLPFYDEAATITATLNYFGANDTCAREMVLGTYNARFAQEERYRHAGLVRRLYTVSVGNSPTFVAKTDGFEEYFSVPLGVICPELQTMTALNSKVLESGLEINLSLLPTSECCIRMARGVPLTAGLNGKLATDSYRISDCFLNIVHYKTNFADLGMLKSMLPFTSIFETIAPVENASSISHQWTLNRSGFLRGYILALLPNKTRLAATDEIIPGFGDDNEIGGNNGLLGMYFEQFAFDSIMVNIGGVEYPMTQQPQITDKSLASYLAAVQNSHLVMGSAYGVDDVRDFLKQYFCVFVPVNTYVKSTELETLYLSSTGNGLAIPDGTELHVLGVQDCLLEVMDGQTRIESK